MYPQDQNIAARILLGRPIWGGGGGGGGDLKPPTHQKKQQQKKQKNRIVPTLGYVRRI